MDSLRTLDDVEVDVFVDGSGFEAGAVEGDGEDFLLLLFGEAAAEVGFEFLDEQGQAFCAAAAVADGVLDCLLRGWCRR